MLDQGRISSVQLFLLLVLVEAATAFLYAPSAVIEMAGRDSWLSSTIIPSIFGLAVALVCIALAKGFHSRFLPNTCPRY